jgi:hypothetical protein
MPERRFDTGYWNDPDIMKLPMRAKLLYLYLWTNRHCNQAGLYEIALETIHWETGLELEELPKLLQLLEKKVGWYPDQNLVWVRNFLHRQTQSPKFLAAAAKCLKTITNNGLVREFIEYNERYTLLIPYQYPTDTLPIPSYSDSLSYAHANAHALSDKEGVVKGEGLAKEDQAIVSVWRGVKGLVMELPEILELLSRIKADFPGVDILSESRKWAARKISEPLTPRSRPSSQIYNFMANRSKWDEENKGRGVKESLYPDINCSACHYCGPDVGHKNCPLCGEPFKRDK